MGIRLGLSSMQDSEYRGSMVSVLDIGYRIRKINSLLALKATRVHSFWTPEAEFKEFEPRRDAV